MANGNRADVDDDDITIDCDRMTVRVAGSQPATTAFAGLLGVNEINPAGYAIARAIEGEGGDLMPLAFCRELPEMQAFASEAEPGRTLTIPIDKAKDTELCGGDGPHLGYWGAGNASDLKDWISNGPPSGVNVVLPPPSPQCDALTSPTANPGWCDGEPGVKTSVQKALKDDRTCTQSAGCQALTFLVYDELRYYGGTKADYKPYAFLDAIVREVKTNPASSQSITLEFVAFRREPGESSRLANSSSQCSADGAPAGDPNCDQ